MNHCVFASCSTLNRRRNLRFQRKSKKGPQRTQLVFREVSDEPPKRITARFLNRRRIYASNESITAIAAACFAHLPKLGSFARTVPCTAILKAGERMGSNETLSPFARNGLALEIGNTRWHASSRYLVRKRSKVPGTESAE